MEASNLGFQIWAIAVYLVSTSLKGVSSMKLHRDLEITQKGLSPWLRCVHMLTYSPMVAARKKKNISVKSIACPKR